jgi:hypothetical protein
MGCVGVKAIVHFEIVPTLALFLGLAAVNLRGRAPESTLLSGEQLSCRRIEITREAVARFRSSAGHFKYFTASTAFPRWL